MNASEISTLKNLIQVNLDAADGLNTAADNINDSVMQSFLSRCARVRRKYARMLYLNLSREEAMQWGEKLEANVNNALNRLKSATYKFYPAAILKECRHAEEYAMKLYDEALSLNLSTSVREQLSTQKQAMKERYSELTSMTSQLEQWATGYSSPRTS